MLVWATFRLWNASLKKSGSRDLNSIDVALPLTQTEEGELKSLLLHW